MEIKQTSTVSDNVSATTQTTAQTTNKTSSNTATMDGKSFKHELTEVKQSEKTERKEITASVPKAIDTEFLVIAKNYNIDKNQQKNSKDLMENNVVKSMVKSGTKTKSATNNEDSETDKELINVQNSLLNYDVINDKMIVNPNIENSFATQKKCFEFESLQSVIEKSFDNKTTIELFKYMDENLTSGKEKITGLAATISSSDTDTAKTKSIMVSQNDAVFFSDLIKNNELMAQGLKPNEITMKDIDSSEVQKSAKVSKALLDMVDEAAKTNKPFRIDFDKDLSVIIKVNKDGKISAEFLPGDKAVEQYLRASLPELRQKFDEQELNYKELSYKQSKDKREQSSRKNKENSNE